MRPQENGNRTEVRWASVGGLRVEGRPLFDFTVRPWSPEALTAARTPRTCVPDGRLWVNVDAALHGLGTAVVRAGRAAGVPARPTPVAFSLRAASPE